MTTFRRGCKRCGTVPVQWGDLTAPARTVVCLVLLGRDVDVPTPYAVVDELRSFYRHAPHTVAPSGVLDRARRYLEGA